MGGLRPRSLYLDLDLDLSPSLSLSVSLSRARDWMAGGPGNYNNYNNNIK